MKTMSILRISKTALELLSLIAMAAVFVLFALIFDNYPADKTAFIMLFGRGFTIEKITLFGLFAVCAGSNAILFIISRFPALYRYPFKITADNIEIQYHLAKIMLSIIQILISAFFWQLFIQMYNNGVNGSSVWDWNILFVFFGLAGATVLFYIFMAHRYR
jgi:hypothetical protein